MPTFLAALAIVADVVTDTLITVGVPGAIAVAAGTFAEIAAVVGTAALLIDSAFAKVTPEGLRETFRQAIPPRRRGVGVTRIGGAYLLDAANSKNDLFRVVAFCDGTVGNITRHYLAQDIVALSGTVVEKMQNGAYPNSCASIYTQYGQTGVGAFAAINAQAPSVWPADAYGTGIFMGATGMYGGSLQSYPTAYPRGPAVLNIVGEINVAYDWRDGTQAQNNPATWKNTTNPIVGLVTELFAFRGYDWATDFAPALDQLTAAANICDAPINYLNVFAQVSVFSATGAAHVILELAAPTPPIGSTIFIGGQSFTVSGVSTVTVGGVTGHQINFTGGVLLAGVGVQTAVRWQATLTNPETEPTYACGGAWNADEAEADTVKRFLEGCDGWMARRGSDGAMVIRAGAYYAPTVTLGPDEVISYTWQPDIEVGKAITQLLPAYVAPAFDYNQTDTTPWQDDAAIAKYGLSSQPYRPDMVQSNGQVRRLAKRRLARLLAHNETLTCKPSALRAIGERYIRLQLGGTETADFEDIVVEIIGDVSIIDNGMAIMFPIAPADPTIDAWDCYTDEGDGPAATAPAGAAGLVAPTLTGVTPGVGLAGPGGVANLRLSLQAIGPADLAATDSLTWLSQWNVTGSTDAPVQQTHIGQPAGAVVLNTATVLADASIDVQVAYQTGGGQLSPWSATTTVSTSTTAIAPDAPSMITASDIGVGVGFVQWRNSASANFDHARVFRAAHGAGFGAATDVSGPLTGVANGVQSFSDPSGAGNFDYWVVAENASNTASTPDGPANVTVTAVPGGAAPGAPTLIATANLTSGESWIGWTNPSSPNFDHAKVWRAAHGAGFGAATNVSGAQHGTTGASQSYNDIPGAGSWDYWVTAENVGNVASTPDGPSHVTVT